MSVRCVHDDVDQGPVHRNVKNEMRGRVIVAHGSRSNYDMVN